MLVPRFVSVLCGSVSTGEVAVRMLTCPAQCRLLLWSLVTSLETLCADSLLSTRSEWIQSSLSSGSMQLGSSNRALFICLVTG